MESLSKPTPTPLAVAPTLPTARPFLKWAGGKSQLLAEIIPRITNRIEKFYEPFLGGAAVFFRLAPQKAILSDTNAALIETYIAVRDQLENVIIELRKHRYEEAYFYQIRDADRLPEFLAWTSAERAARMIFLNKTCFNGLHRVNAQGHFNVPFGRYVNPTIVDEVNLRACSRMLQNAQIAHAPFLHIEEIVTPGDFVYFDPPYVPLSKTASFTAYSKDGFTEQDQRALAELCLRLTKRNVKFLLSNSDVPLIRSLYQGSEFRINTVSASRSLNSKADKRGKISEVLVSNF